MVTMTIYAILILILFSFALSLWYFQHDMKRKMQYREFVEDAKDGIFNDFSSNAKYTFSSTKGIALYKKEDGKYLLKSQSKLYDTSIEY